MTDGAGHAGESQLLCAAPREYSRRGVVEKSQYDVIVSGGGPSGIAAAIAAARAGAHTLLIEKNPFFGGAWTAASMSLVIDYDNKPGLMSEIRNELTARGAFERWYGWAGLFTVEPMKLLLDDMLAQAKVDLRLHTLVVGAESEGRQISALRTASKSGLETFSAQIYVDATGDGDLAARAGCGFEMGSPDDGTCQPGTMFGLVGGWPTPLPEALEVKTALQAGGYPFTYTGITLFAQPGQPGLAFLMASHLYALDPTDADSLTHAELEGRRQVRRAVEVLHNSGDSRFSGLFLISSGPMAGIREGRRIHGIYTMTADDCRTGRRFDDGICEATFNIDVHHLDPANPEPYHPYGVPGRVLKAVPFELYGEYVPPYQIPFRSLVAKDKDNLLLTGRCISGDFLAHASYRVTGNAVPLGEVAGKAAALCTNRHIHPVNLSLADVAACRTR
jgi:hypothetical protein